MKIALIAPPFIPVPPVSYGGTELFVAGLACELSRRGHEVIVYANGESRLPCEVRWMFRDSDWPPRDPASSALKNMEHTAWAMRDAAAERPDVIHTNDAFALPVCCFARRPVVHTLHHPHEPSLTDLYGRHPHVKYVAISRSQRAREPTLGCAVIHHGIPLEEYPFEAEKEPYLCFLGRLAPVKGAHIAARAARRAGRPLKIAGEIQPFFRDYWESEVRPLVDGKLIEYVGEADQAAKRELLRRSSGLLFPIQWNEPFGLVMIEAMACGTPVLAFPGGAVEEVVRDGVSGWICRGEDDLAARAAEPGIPAASCRAHVEAHFTVGAMAEGYEALYWTVRSAEADEPASGERSPLRTAA